MALAYFLTFSTYGTWLPGNAKGSVDREHRAYDTPLLPIDPARENSAREQLAQPPYILDAAARDFVCQAVIALSAERGWNLLAVPVRSNHVHVVIQAERAWPDHERLKSESFA